MIVHTVTVTRGNVYVVEAYDYESLGRSWIDMSNIIHDLYLINSDSMTAAEERALDQANAWLVGCFDGSGDTCSILIFENANTGNAIAFLFSEGDSNE